MSIFQSIPAILLIATSDGQSEIGEAIGPRLTIIFQASERRGGPLDDKLSDHGPSGLNCLLCTHLGNHYSDTCNSLSAATRNVGANMLHPMVRRYSRICFGTDH